VLKDCARHRIQRLLAEDVGRTRWCKRIVTADERYEKQKNTDFYCTLAVQYASTAQNLPTRAQF